MSPYDNLLSVHSPGAASGQAGKPYTLHVRVVFPTYLCFREEAYSLLSKSPFFGTWDPDVLRNYVDYALIEDSSGQVSLKCTNFQVRTRAPGTGVTPAEN